MKKKKITALLLAGMLLVGGTFAGTRALFMDKTEVAAELSISTGDVDIEVLGGNSNISNYGEWVLDRAGNEAKDGSTVKGETGTDGEVYEHLGNKQIDVEKSDLSENQPFANNLKPGDKLTKTLTIKNVGTLVAEMKAEAKGEISKGGNLFELRTEGIDKIKNKLIPGEKADIKLIVEIKDDGNNHEHVPKEGNLEKNIGSLNSDFQENTVIDLKDAWTLTATQQTK